MDTEDRRNHAREPKQLAVIYYFEDESRARRIEEATLSSDLGAGGLSMLVSHPIEPGTRLNLKLLIRKQSLNCVGTVIHRAPEDQAWRVGVELNLDEATREKLNRALEG